MQLMCYDWLMIHNTDGNKPGVFQEFFKASDVDGDLLLIELLVKHNSYVKVAEILEAEHGLSILPSSVRYHARRLNIELQFVYRRWFDKHADDMIEYQRRDLIRED